MAVATKKLIGLLNDRTDLVSIFQRQLANHLSNMYETEVAVAISTAIDFDQNGSAILYERKNDSYAFINIDDLSVKSDSFIRAINFNIYDDTDDAQQVIIAIFSKKINISDAVEVDDVVKIYTDRCINNIRRNIRKEVVLAKVNSNDLGSFLYRLLNEQDVKNILSCEHISVFVKDWIGQIIRLRGTTTRLRNGRRASDIRFHSEDKAKRIVACHVSGTPIHEYSLNSKLPINGDSHEVAPDGAWSRIYWPIKLMNSTEIFLKRQPDRNNDGVIRFTNCLGPDGEKIPFLWIHRNIIEYFCELLFIIVDAFSAADEASFKKDEAFHNSMSVVDTIIRNIEAVSDSIFDPTKQRKEERPPRFYLEPMSDNKHVSQQRIFQLLRTAYASAKDISFQISRANDDIPFDRSESTDFLVRDVLVRALELVPDMCTVHSAKEGFQIPTIVDMVPLSEELPPPVRGAPEALVSVFANLFENSVKYRKPDTRVVIDVSVEVERDYVLVTVKDHGVGVAPSDIQRIFNRGWRGDNAHEFAPRGSGLGLSWCEKVLKSFDATITARSGKAGLEVMVRLARV